MAWIQIEDTLPDHRKVGRLASILKIDNDSAVGKLLRFWLWIVNNREDGSFSESDIDTIAIVMRYRGEPQDLVDALVSSGFVEREGEDYVAHGWVERMQLLLERRERVRKQTAERVRKYRERKKEAEKEVGNAECNALRNAQVTHPQYSTVQNQETISLYPSISVSQSVSLKSNRADGPTDRRTTLGDVMYQVEGKILLESYDRDLVKAILVEILNAQNGQDQELAEISRHLSFENIEHVIRAVQNAGEVQNPAGYIRSCIRNSLLDVAAHNQF